jgi:hypothetical protein
VREKYCRLVADKPSEQVDGSKLVMSASRGGTLPKAMFPTLISMDRSMTRQPECPHEVTSRAPRDDESVEQIIALL